MHTSDAVDGVISRGGISKDSSSSSSGAAHVVHIRCPSSCTNDSSEFNTVFRSRMEQISLHVSPIAPISCGSGTPHVLTQSASSFSITASSKRDRDHSFQLQKTESGLLLQQTMPIDGLIDTFLALVMDCKAASNQNEHVAGFLAKYEKLALRIQSLRINTQDFDIVKTLATGAVGKVCLVIGRSNKQVYAMKILKKTDLLTQREAAYFMEERNALVYGQKSPWITTLYAAFQDEENLYLVMEYASGGSLRSLMMNRETLMTEDEARFYVAEILLGLEELHRLNFIHRDVKPENCLIVSSGHLKLADFGSCIRIGDSSGVHETVGTPDYISPEILRAHEGNVSYGREVDMWSLGIIMYELLFDEVPFFSESRMGIFGKIMDHEKHFSFPSDGDVTDESKDLMSKLICDAKVRLGKVGGAADIKKHPWFSSISFDTMHNATPPFIPELSGPDDTRYFNEENESKKFARKPLPKTREFAGANLPFVGYTYVQNACANILWPFQQQQGPHQLQKFRMPSSRSGASLNSAAGLGWADEKRRLEENLAGLEGKLAKEAQHRDELASSVSRLEREKARIEGELRRMQTVETDAIRDREEGESRLTALRRRLDSESSTARAREKALEEEKDAVLNELRELKRENERLKSIEEKEKAASAERDDLENMMQKVHGKAAAARAERDEALLKVEEISRKLQREVSKREDYEQETQRLLQKNDGLVIDLASARKTISNELAKSERLEMEHRELSRTKSMLMVDLLSAKRRADELESEKLALENATSAKFKSANDLYDLSTEIANLNSARAKDTESLATLTESLANVTNQKVEVEKELSCSREALLQESVNTKELKAKLSELEEQLSANAERLSILQERKERAESLHAEAEKTVQSVRVLLSQESQKVQEKELLTQSQHRNILALQAELENLKLALKDDIEAKEEQQAQLSGLEKSLSDERRARADEEASREKLEALIEELRAEVLLLQGRVNRMKDEQSKLIAERDEASIAFADERAELLARIEAGERSREALEDEIVQLKQHLEDSSVSVTNFEDEVAIWKVRADELETELADMRTQRNIDANLIASKQNKIDELEYQLKREVSSSQERLTKSADSLRSPDSSSIHSHSTADRTKLKLRNVLFFRSQQQKAEQEKAMQKINEAEEDVKRDRHSRRFSGGSSSSFKSSLTKLSDPVPIFEFDSMTILKGILKIPKVDGKVRKGWRIKLAVVRDYKIYLYDNNVESGDGIVIADLRADVFVAQTVSQNQLIHASAKEIDCVFLVQATQLVEVQDEHTSPMNPTEIARRVAKNKTDISYEEKMLEAAEKMLRAAPENNKAPIQAKVDEAKKRIVRLKLELETLGWKEDGLNDEASTIDGAGRMNASSFDELSVEPTQEEIEMTRSELQQQLDAETKKYAGLLNLGLSPNTKIPTYSPSPSSSRDKKHVSKSHSSVAAEQVSLQQELDSCEQNVCRLKEDLEALNSSDKTKISLLVRRSKELRTNGHTFRVRDSTKPLDCAHCHDALWEKRILECVSCKLVCHNSCLQLVEQSCKEVLSLNKTKPLYFMADSPAERARWIAGLNFFRQEAMRAKYGGPPPLTPKKMKFPGHVSQFSTALSPLKSSSTSSLLK